MTESSKKPLRLLNRNRVHDIALLGAVLCAASMTRLSAEAGLAIFALGMAVQVWSKAVLRRDRQLCTMGPYAICRHPFYLGNGLMDWGLCAMTGNPWLAAFYPVVFLLAYVPTAIEEEQVLAGLFPSEQATYFSSTARFLPFSTRAFRDWRGPLSWDVFLKERELSRCVRHAAFPLIVLLAARLWKGKTLVPDGLSLALAGAAVVLWISAVAVHRTVELQQR